MNFKLLILVIAGLFLSQNINAYGQDEKDDATLSAEIFSEALKLAKKKKWDKAKAKFQDCRQYWQHYNESLLYEKIINDSQSKAVKNSVAKDGFKALGEDFFDTKTKKALKRIDKLIKKNATYWPLYVIKGRMHNTLSQTEEAEVAFAKAIEFSDNTALAYIFRGKYFADLAERKKAVTDFTKAIKLEATAINYFERGFVYCLQRKYDPAIKDFEAAIKTNPNWEKTTIVLEAFHNHGVALVQKKSSKNAIRYFSKTIKIDPDYTMAYLNRGIAYKNIKQYSKALKDFSVCIEKNPGMRAPYYQRALTHYGRKHYLKAAADLKKLLTIIPDDKEALSKIADSYQKAGKPDKSIRYLNKLIALDKRYHWAYYHRGFAYTSLRKGKQAINSFKTFIALAPKQFYKQIATAEAEIQKLRRRGY